MTHSFPREKLPNMKTTIGSLSTRRFCQHIRHKDEEGLSRYQNVWRDLIALTTSRQSYGYASCYFDSIFFIFATSCFFDFLQNDTDARFCRPSPEVCVVWRHFWFRNHFRLPPVAQRRLVLKSSLIYYFTFSQPYKTHEFRFRTLLESPEAFGCPVFRFFLFNTDRGLTSSGCFRFRCGFVSWFVEFLNSLRIFFSCLLGSRRDFSTCL